MITLRRGDRLPTVAVLQSYLNQVPSTAEYLSVDGIFGRYTAGAVERFRSANRLGRSEIVDYEVWRRVVGAEWQIIDSVDRTDHDSRRHAILDHEDLAPYGQTVLEQFGLSQGAPVVLSTIHSRARIGQVVLLRFHGHGGPGEMIVSSGRSGNRGSSFDHRYGAGFFEALRVLRPIFASFGSVEMHGCRVGQGAAGRALLSGMANALGVPVTGALRSQLGGGRTTFKFEGPTVTICPGGESLPNWSRRVGTVSMPRPLLHRPAGAPAARPRP